LLLQLWYPNPDERIELRKFSNFSVEQMHALSHDNILAWWLSDSSTFSEEITSTLKYRNRGVNVHSGKEQGEPATDEARRMKTRKLTIHPSSESSSIRGPIHIQQKRINPKPLKSSLFILDALSQTLPTENSHNPLSYSHHITLQMTP
jgi:hypothetical protein